MNAPIWIGLNDLRSDRDFRWSDGTTPTYWNWGFLEPNNKFKKEHCVNIIGQGQMKWNDNDCIQRFGSICERKEGNAFKYYKKYSSLNNPFASTVKPLKTDIP